MRECLLSFRLCVLCLKLVYEKKKRNSNFARTYFIRLCCCFSSLQWINFNYGINTNKRHSLDRYAVQIVPIRRWRNRISPRAKGRLLFAFEHFHLIASDVQWVRQMNCRGISCERNGLTLAAAADDDVIHFRWLWQRCSNMSLTYFLRFLLVLD